MVCSVSQTERNQLGRSHPNILLLRFVPHYLEVLWSHPSTARSRTRSLSKLSHDQLDNAWGHFQAECAPWLETSTPSVAWWLDHPCMPDRACDSLNCSRDPTRGDQCQNIHPLFVHHQPRNDLSCFASFLSARIFWSCSHKTINSPQSPLPRQANLHLWCMYPWCMHPWCMHPWCMYPWCLYPWCLYLWCTYPWCTYLWCLYP